MLPAPERDTAVFGPRQWFIPIEDDASRPMFTTKEDAEAAIRLAYSYAQRERAEISEKLTELARDLT